MTVTGNLEGTDTIHIDGTVTGNITVTNTLVIGKSGKVEGTVEAKHVIINGELQGSIKCENLDVMQTGKVSRYIEAVHLTLDGTVDGDIMGSDSIDILENANIHAVKLHSKNITVHGKVQGKIIASELLEIGKQGFVEGEITVKNIKTEEGGRMEGTMTTYQDEDFSIQSQKKEKVTPKKSTITKSKKETEDDFFSNK